MKKILKIPLFAFALFASNAYSQQLVRATNVNMVTTAGTKIVIDGGISFIGSSVLKSTADSIYLYKSTVSSPEGWLDSTGGTGVMDLTSTGSVFFNGSQRQSFWGNTRFYNLFIRNTRGDTLLSSCEVRNLLHLDTGFVYTRSGFGLDSLLVSNMASAAIVSTSNFTKSWVNGRLSRIANLTGAANEYLFPIGKIKLPDSLYAPIKIDKSNATANTWTAEYFPATPFNYLNVNPPIDHISQVEYWEITALNSGVPGADAKVSLSWRTYSIVSPSAAQRANLLVVQYAANPGYAWWKLGAVGLHTVLSLPDSSFGYVTHNTYLGAFSNPERRFTLGTSSSTNPLPIKLIYFTAIGDGNKVRLNWEVANEQDIVTYEVQKSLTASNFTHLSTVASRQQSQSAYVDYDLNPAMGWNYYRLKIIDKSGNFTYSPIRPVKFTKGLEEVKIFPNPVRDVLNIQLPSSYVNKSDLLIYGIDGKFISSRRPAVNNIMMNVLSLPAGTYILQIIKANGDKESFRFVKQQ